MKRYRVFYLEETLADRFREAAPRKEPPALRSAHYRESALVQARTPYEAWMRLREQPEERPLAVGDVLQAETEEPLLCLYWGFESAQWLDSIAASANMS